MKNRNSREQLTKEAEANMIKARKDAKMWRECFNRQSKYCRPKIKDKIAKLSFIALLLTMTAAIFYTPTGN